MSAAAAKLEVSGLQKRFGGLTAVRDVSFSVHAGEILGLIGPNGSGKSTVMKSILGVERPDAGSVRVDGQEVSGWPPHRIARLGVGMVFQHSRPLYRQTVLENILLGLLPDHLLDLLPTAATEARARAIAERVGLTAVLDRRPATLPFADLRKIEIAKAIARDPQVVLIDEPFAGLTARETASFARLITEMRDDGRAVLIVDHNVKSMSALVDRVYAMHVGEKIAEGTVQGGDGERDRAQGLSRRRAGNGGASGIRFWRRPDAVSRDRESERRLWQGAGSGECLAACASGGIRRRRRTERRRQDDAVQRHLGPHPPCRRHPPGRPALARQDRGDDRARRDRAVAGGPRTVRRDDGQREPGHGRPSARETRTGPSAAEWLFNLFPILKERQGQTAVTLSGGEQQMLTIARALMMKPDLLILDEPTLGLAPVIMEQISKALERLRQTTDITVLLGEQNVTFALPHADRVYVLEHGLIVWEGEPGRFAAEAGARYL